MHHSDSHVSLSNLIDNKQARLSRQREDARRIAAAAAPVARCRLRSLTTYSVSPFLFDDLTIDCAAHLHAPCATTQISLMAMRGSALDDASTFPAPPQFKGGGTSMGGGGGGSGSGSGGVHGATPEMEEVLREKKRLEGLLSNIEMEIYKVGSGAGGGGWGGICVPRPSSSSPVSRSTGQSNRHYVTSPSSCLCDHPTPHQQGEEEYFERTPHGNIVRGWDGVLDKCVLLLCVVVYVCMYVCNTCGHLPPCPLHVIPPPTHTPNHPTTASPPRSGGTKGGSASSPGPRTPSGSSTWSRPWTRPCSAAWGLRT